MKLQAKELLEKYQSGLCTEEEKTLVEAYYNQWAPAEPYHLSEDELNIGLTKLDLSINKLVAVSQNSYPLWIRIAAAAAILIIVGTVALFYSKNSNITGRITYATDIAPGSDKAILILADGRRINLDEVKNGEIKTQEGTVLRKVNSQLQYDQLGLKAGKGESRGKSEKVVESLNTIQTPFGGQYGVILSDGTHVWLNAASSISYPVEFTGNERKVTITGEAYFEVAKNKNKPFKVIAGNQIVQVLGTHFNINSYTDEAVVKTTLLEGSVKVNLAGEGAILHPGQQAQAVQNRRILVLAVNTDEVVSWKDGEFFFKDENFKTNMRKIARWYNVDISYDESAPKNLQLGGWISRAKNISEVLNMMEATGNVHFKIEGRRITVTK